MIVPYIGSLNHPTLLAIESTCKEIYKEVVVLTLGVQMVWGITDSVVNAIGQET